MIVKKATNLQSFRIGHHPVWYAWYNALYMTYYLDTLVPPLLLRVISLHDNKLLDNSSLNYNIASNCPFLT